MAPPSPARSWRQELEASLTTAIAQLDASDAVKGIYTRVGEGPVGGGPSGGQAEQGSHLVTVEVNLVGSTEREFSPRTSAMPGRRGPQSCGPRGDELNRPFG